MNLDELSYAEKLALVGRWDLWRRPEQAPPAGAWWVWMILSGRGWGKTRTGAEAVREVVSSGRCRRIHLVARTAADARDTMIEGESGLLAVCAGDAGGAPKYEPSKRRVTWPSGAMALAFSAEEPDALRGPQCGFWWADELASWKYIQDTWDNLQFGARLGGDVRGIITTTPRPIKLLKQLVADRRVRVTRGSTKENADNLAGNALAVLMERYQGTRLGRQELDGEILDDNPNALWRRGDIESTRILPVACPTLIKIVVAVDPAISANENSDETGIVVVGVAAPRVIRIRPDGTAEKEPAHFYVLEDATVSMASPDQWGRAAVAATARHDADVIVAETNQGGDMVTANIKTINPLVKVVGVHASRGKRTRAEPVSALYEQGRVHHVGCFPELEDQMCEWEPGRDSPDRMDALVWGLTELMEGTRPAGPGAAATGGARIITGSW